MNPKKLNRIIFFLIIILFPLKSMPQSMEESQKEIYRITAYKKGDNQVISQSNIVEITSPLRLYIPNAFTPNNDGLNDIFKAEGQGIAEYNMKIFDRWGEMIFETDDIQSGWDGMYKGKMSESGNYIYQVVAKGEKTRRTIRSGSIILIP